MNATKIRFPSATDRVFPIEMRQRVADYFESRGISDKANRSMVLRTAVMLLLTFGSYGLILTGDFGPWVMICLCVAMGVGLAGIGLGVAHDALHGSYSKSAQVNAVIGSLFDLVGANSYLWILTHNKIHHTYTNVPGLDEDIAVTSPMLRTSPTEPLRSFHRWQQLYAWPLYGLATINWLYIKDYKYIFAKRLGSFDPVDHPAAEIRKLFLWKAIAYTWTMVLPLLVLDIAWWQYLVGFLAFHGTAGLILGVVFMMAHVVEEAAFPEVNAAGELEDGWMVHQCRTSVNFARRNRLLTWYLGGLNYQLEHHLFPGVCSVHYPAISSIVERMCNEHDVPYREHPTLGMAMRSHYRQLRTFGRSRPSPA